MNSEDWKRDLEMYINYYDNYITITKSFIRFLFISVPDGLLYQ